MTLPSPPASISMSQVNVELSLPATTLITLNQANVRNLAGKPTSNSQISMSDLYGKSSFTAITATGPGGTPIVSGNYQLFVYTSPGGSFNVSNAGSEGLVDYLVVAGGGGGGGTAGTTPTPNGPRAGSGGGGAGGLRTGSLTITATNYPITVGSGGAAGPFPSSTNGTSGNPSVFHTITSAGGGGGAGCHPPTGVSVLGSSGGSGGGGVGAGPSGNGGAGNTPPVSPPQGNPGGYGDGGTGGGGGGASGSGGNAGPPASVGGAGTLIPWVPASYGSPAGYFSGGGGGTNGDSSNTGGGGKTPPRSGEPLTSPLRNGVANTGGGGAGGGDAPPTYLAGSGGSGIVIIRYRLS